MQQIQATQMRVDCDSVLAADIGLCSLGTIYFAGPV